MNTNHNYLIIIFRSILRPRYNIFLVFFFTIFHFDLNKVHKKKNVNICFSTRNLYIFDENTSKYCSWMIVVHVHATVFFSKVNQACHNIANCIKPGSVSKKTDKHATDCSKSVYLGVK